MFKKNLIISFFILIILFVLGCANKHKYQSNIDKKLENLPFDYSFDNAVEDNYVIVQMGKRYNINTLENFINKIKNNRPCSLRYIVCSESGDDLIIQDVYFDTNQFIVFSDYSRDQSEKKDIEYHIYYNWKIQEQGNIEIEESRREVVLWSNNAMSGTRSIIIG